MSRQPISGDAGWADYLRGFTIQGAREDTTRCTTFTNPVLKVVCKAPCQCTGMTFDHLSGETVFFWECVTGHQATMLAPPLAEQH